jgi:hypothetical protein
VTIRTITARGIMMAALVAVLYFGHLQWWDYGFLMIGFHAGYLLGSHWKLGDYNAGVEAAWKALQVERERHEADVAEIHESYKLPYTRKTVQ